MMFLRHLRCATSFASRCEVEGAEMGATRGIGALSSPFNRSSVAFWEDDKADCEVDKAAI